MELTTSQYGVTGNVSFIAGADNSSGYGWAITRSLGDAGATTIIGTWPLVLKIF